MIQIKTPEQIKIMREGGVINETALKEALNFTKPGVTTKQIDQVAFETIIKMGGKPAFKRVPGYNFTTCINVNEGLVHGLPNSYVVKEGDLVKVDVGTFFKGFNTDLSYTMEVLTTKESDFLSVGKNALESGIEHFVVGNRVGAISNAIQTVVEKAGYSVSHDLVGHGVGKDLHEDPFVPGYGSPKDGPLIKAGMVFAIEVIYQKGKPEIKVLSDNWTISTKDGSLSGLFEKTVASTKNGPMIVCGY